MGSLCKEDGRDHLIHFGEGCLRRAVCEYVEFYNRERPHQGLNNELIAPEGREIKREDEVKVKSRLGGLLDYYTRWAWFSFSILPGLS